MRAALAAVATLFIVAAQAYVHPAPSQQQLRARALKAKADTHVLLPRQSPQPCPQAYVCPEPRPYPNTPETGDDPGPNRFKCRIGQSASDPNFAFCIYEKNTGNLVVSTPSGLENVCWERGMPNPACPITQTRKRGVPKRHIPSSPRPAARSVDIARFAKKHEA
jgi:hypothetical protein